MGALMDAVLSTPKLDHSLVNGDEEEPVAKVQAKPRVVRRSVNFFFVFFFNFKS